MFHYDSIHDYHFIIEQFAKNIDAQFECLVENAEKYITFSVPISKELDNDKAITYKLKFNDSFRFMSTSLSDLVDNLSEIYSKKSKDKNCKSECDLIGLKNNKLYCRCKECNKRWLKPVKGLIKKYPSLYQFCKDEINKFNLLLRKCFYPYEFMDSGERFDD